MLQNDRTWIVIAYFGLAGVVVALYFHQTEISRSESARSAANHAKVAQCIQSVPELRKINRFVRGVYTFHRIIAENSKFSLDATPKSSPMYQVRLRNYRRVKQTVLDVSGVRFHVPTRAECDGLLHD